MTGWATLEVIREFRAGPFGWVLDIADVFLLAFIIYQLLKLIRGTRSVLRGGQWFPPRGRLVVSVAPPLMPEGSDWAVAIRLRDEVREEILERCGEPDLAAESNPP